MGRLLLRNGHFQCLQEPVNQASGGSVVVLHFDHHFVVYGQPGGALDRQENGIPHQGRTWSLQAVWHQIWLCQKRGNLAILSSNYQKTKTSIKFLKLKLTSLYKVLAVIMCMIWAKNKPERVEFDPISGSYWNFRLCCATWTHYCVLPFTEF